MFPYNSAYACELVWRWNMEIIKRSVSGTLESSDIMITVEPNGENGRVIDLDSSVEKQFGDSIRETMRNLLDQFQIGNIKISAIDKGALDCIIVARLKAAIYDAITEKDREKEVFKA